MNNAELHSALSLSGFGVSFGKKVILDGISFELKADGIDVLMGPVKAGKSTLFRTLAGLYQGHSLHRSWGEVRVSGQPVAPGHRPALMQQHAKVYDMPLLDVLLEFVHESQRRSVSGWRDQAIAWLSDYGLPDAIDQLNMPLLQTSTRMQRSILILAQALRKPPLLMIDEPTYGLDEADVTWMIDWFKKLSVHGKLFISLHNQAQARRLADRVILIGGGRVLAHQETMQFFQRPANEWVEQFIRSGSLSLPSPDARPEELDVVVDAPPPLSQAARMAIEGELVAPPEAPAESVECAAPVLAPEEAAQPQSEQSTVVSDFLAVSMPVSEVKQAPLDEAITSPPSGEVPFVSPVAELPVKDALKPVMRNLVSLPPPSRDGVAQASTVGKVHYHSGGAPRGFNWIVPGKVAGCPAPGVSASIDYDLELLARTGVTRLITLTEDNLDQVILGRHKLTNVHLPIFDREAPSIAQTHMLLMRMQKFIENGDVLAVHCKAGLGRTGTILAAWLIREGGLSAEAAVTRLRMIEPGYIQSEVQEEFLRSYEADLTQRLL